MELCCGIFPKFWQKSKANMVDDAIWNNEEGGNAGGGGPPPSSIDISAGNFVAKITNDEVEDEMEENMQQVSTILGNLKNMASDMNVEISNQNNQIERIAIKGSANETGIKTAIDVAKNLRMKWFQNTCFNKTKLYFIFLQNRNPLSKLSELRQLVSQVNMNVDNVSFLYDEQNVQVKYNR